MRTVYKNDMVIHLWANRSQDEARTANRNLYFKGDTLFSYGSHFPLARHVTNTAGERATLVNCRKYSVTTSAHQSILDRSLVRDCPTFHTEASFWDCYAPDIKRERIMADYAERRDAMLTRALKSRGHNRAWQLSRAQDYVQEANEFAQFFGLTDQLSLPADFAERVTYANAMVTAEKARARIRNAANIERRKRDCLAGLAAWRLDGTKEMPWGAAEFMTEEDRALVAERNAGKIALWQSGQIRDMPEEYQGDILMRVNGGDIETSQHATFPLSHGVKAFAMIKGCREAGRAFHRNGHSIHLGLFQIDAITATGDVKAGCHFVRWNEIARIAGELGVF